MRPATRLTWLRGFSQSAMAAVTLTHWGDQVLTPHTKLDRILVLLSSKLPATGLNWRAGRLHAHMQAVNKRLFFHCIAQMHASQRMGSVFVT
jgi:hypothetical protein